MKRIIIKNITILSAIIILLFISKYLTTEVVCLADVFNVQPTPGREYNGYIFQLANDAVVRLDRRENLRIRVLHEPQNLFHAATLQDIMNFVAPEFILHIGPNYGIYLDTIPSRPAPPTFAPHAFGSVN